jgi:hypothetical protein
MELTLVLPESIGRQVRRLPDPNRFIVEVLARALRDREVADPAPLPDSREREDAWRNSNREFLQSHFVGEWVVLEGEEIVAHSEDAAQAVGEARSKGVAVPFVFYVEPPREPGVVRLGL